MTLIAFSGPHGVGKTTFAHRLTHLLKQNGQSVTMVPSASRHSRYLASGDLSPNMHLEIICLQIAVETQAILDADIVISDRSIFDFLTYAICRFGNESEIVQLLMPFCKSYAKRYKSIILIRNGFISGIKAERPKSKDIDVCEFEKQLSLLVSNQSSVKLAEDEDTLDSYFKSLVK